MTTSRYSLNIFDDGGMTMIHLVDSLSDPSTSEDISSVSFSFLGSSYDRQAFQMGAVSVSGLTVDYFKSDGSQASFSDIVAHMTITKTDGGNLLDTISDGQGTQLMRMDDPALLDAFDINASSYYSSGGEVSFGGDSVTSPGTKPMVTFENMQEIPRGNLSFDVWLNQLPDRAEIANLSQIYFQGNFNSSATPLVWEQNTIFDATSGIEFSSPSDASETIPNFGLGNDSNSIADVLWAAGLMTDDLQLISPVKLGTFNTLMFTDSFTYLGMPTDSGDPSLWEIGDLGLGDGGTYGLTNVVLKGLTASPDYMPVQKELNLFDILNYSPSDGGEEPTGPTYKHIGNSTGGTSGIDTSNSDYSPSTGVVEFNIIKDSLVVDTATLYNDNGGDASGTTTPMGVYLDMGLGLASSLVHLKILSPHLKQHKLLSKSIVRPKKYLLILHISMVRQFICQYILMLQVLSIYLNLQHYFALQMENMPVLSQYFIDNMPGTENASGTQNDYSELDGTTQFVAGNYRVSELGHDLYVGFAPAEDGKFYLQLFDANDTLSDYPITNLVEPGENFIGEIVLDDGLIGEASMYAEFFALTTPEAWDSALGTFFWNMDNMQMAPVGVGSVQKSVVSTLDATENDVNTLPWGISLTDYDDVFIGRDDKDNGDGTYTTTVEVVAASLGNDTIDGGGGYNSAYFGHIGTDYFNPLDPVNNVSFDMNSGEVSIYTSTNEYQQNWHGFQEFIGSAAQDFVIGTGENDPSIIDDIFTLTVGDNVFTNNTGSNVMISNGGGGTFYGNGGTDIIFLNDIAGSTNYHYAYGGSGADVIAFGLGEDDVYGDGGEYYGYSSSSGMSSSGSSMSEMDSTDDVYNDEATFAMWDIDEHGGSGLTPPQVPLRLILVHNRSHLT